VAYTEQERRRDSRRNLNGKAWVKLLPEGAELEGTLANFSVHGAGIELKTKIKNLVNREVELRLDFEGFQLRLPGRITHDAEYEATGIEFVGLSQRKIDQLEEILHELDELDKVRKAAAKAPGIS